MEFLNNYFGFNRQQRNGLLVLVFISFALLVARLSLPHFIRPAAIEVRNLPLVPHAGIAGSKNDETAKNAELFVFDPNTVSLRQLLKLGFSEKTAKTFIKYRSKGFVFREKNDVKKIYGISDALYSSIEPYILINGPLHQKKAEPVKPVARQHPMERQVKIIELNSADSAALVALNGIGAGYARRILKYRSILGGYVAVEQLREVYGFTDELYDQVKTQVTVDKSNIKKININKDDFKTVNRHPYLSYELTKTIFDWRRKTTITAVNLREIIKDDPLYTRVLPYISFE
jgi:DNA uptake protein ComE-like DNA-binding protein